MTTPDTAPKGVPTPRTLLRLCAWAAAIGLAFGLYLGREILLAG